MYEILSCFQDNAECLNLTKVYIQTFPVTRTLIWSVLDQYFTKIEKKICAQPQHILELYWQRNASTKVYKYTHFFISIR